jgi:anti-sigma B factor antagonist
MSRPAPEILVCCEDERVCIRIRGRADVSISPGFKELLGGLRERKFRHYELELSGCQIMDSTFLGVLCGFAQKCETELAAPDNKPILFNANDRVTGLLTSLGVDAMFDFRHGSTVDRGPCIPVPKPAGTPSREQLHDTSLKAHQILMSLNPDNIRKFKDLTEFLAEDLKKLRANT